MHWTRSRPGRPRAAWPISGQSTGSPPFRLHGGTRASARDMHLMMRTALPLDSAAMARKISAVAQPHCLNAFGTTRRPVPSRPLAMLKTVTRRPLPPLAMITLAPPLESAAWGGKSDTPSASSVLAPQPSTAAILLPSCGGSTCSGPLLQQQTCTALLKKQQRKPRRLHVRVLAELSLEFSVGVSPGPCVDFMLGHASSTSSCGEVTSLEDNLGVTACEFSSECNLGLGSC
mmetsp:Transcript_41104/g.111126  ORF Transcript_41104/g.111126 Transcript_41104/m.111126 type:complete len:231 (-) Transcript_41104:342-1034(-)